MYSIMKLMGFLISFFGAMSVYLSHTNQNLLSQKLPYIFTLIGIFMLFLGLIILIFCLPKLVAVLSWFILMIFVWSFMPFIVLFKRNLN